MSQITKHALEDSLKVLLLRKRLIRKREFEINAAPKIVEIGGGIYIKPA